jgi:hypothetical protein
MYSRNNLIETIKHKKALKNFNAFFVKNMLYCYTAKLSPQPQLLLALGLLK